MVPRALAFGLMSCLLAGGAVFAAPDGGAPGTGEPAMIPGWNPDNSLYRAFYGAADLDWTWRRVPSGPFDLAVHVFRPRSTPSGPRGTVFLVHGYLEHTGTRTAVIRRLLDAGWLVVGLDLPGHGLSSGPRWTIDDFADYGRAVLAAMDSEAWPRPWRGFGHSTGCSALLEAARLRPACFESLFFEAPLVRSWAWDPSVVGYHFLAKLVPTLPRRKLEDPAHPELLSLLARDPLAAKSVPFSWFAALLSFQDTMAAREPEPTPLVVVQGDADTVVDAAHNLPVLERLFPRHEVLMVRGALHHVFGSSAFSEAWALLDRWSHEGPETPQD